MKGTRGCAAVSEVASYESERGLGKKVRSSGAASFPMHGPIDPRSCLSLSTEHYKTKDLSRLTSDDFQVAA